ncbi:sensor domain-containing diguanylate cyclase [Nocardioides seonyuensis]|uniref:sensor domain-containing diguanylate cyclase n=1 Tax=Nocardioides seonyuensis TaxID=2518371 RepID=UPI00141D9888|nr:diguanylate cyclase [Nocardioides seonyuensis]
MTSVPVLQGLARMVSGEPHDALQRLLALACEQLAMDFAFVSVLDGAGNRTVRQSSYADGTAGPVGLLEPLEATWCGLVVTDGPMLVGDARLEDALQARAKGANRSIVSYAAVPLIKDDGKVFGTLCTLSREPHDSLNPRDLDVLTGLAEVVGPLVSALDAPPAPRPTTTGLADIAAALEGAEDLERLSRPMLDALGDLTGFVTTFLTRIHTDEAMQEVRYVRNVRKDWAMPEGFLIPWKDTLCKRAIEEDRPVVSDVPAVWGDNEGARYIGINAYASVPVTTSDGEIWGTLCAASPVVSEDAGEHLPTMRLFARLIGAQVEREAALKRAREEADTDALTRCASRRVVEPWIAAQLEELMPDEVLVVAFADLDGFKSVNDTLGHAAGDEVLVQVGHRLRSTARPGDLVARLGGDEFVVAARVPRDYAAPMAERVRTAVTFSLIWQGTTVDVRASVGVALSDEHDLSSLISAADAAMYDVKAGRSRRAETASTR